MTVGVLALPVQVRVAQRSCDGRVVLLSICCKRRHCVMPFHLGGTKVVCRLRYFARSARAPLRRNSFASKTFSSCRTQIAADKGNSSVRHARTAHRAAAHYAWLTLKEGGENSHRRGFAAPPPSVREASCNHSRKQNCILRPRVVSQNHDIVIPQHSQKRFRRKIFCEEERRAF